MIIIALLLVALYIYSTRNKESMTDVKDESPVRQSNVTDYTPEENVVIEDNQVMNDENIMTKMESINKADPTTYKKISYSEGERGGVSELDSQFRNTFEDSMNDKGYFNPNDETDGRYATYESKQNRKKLTSEEIYDIDKYLPKELHDDWFEVMPEPIGVKNRHLINVARPVGANTISGSLRNANYDLRASPPCPKFTVSPWLQSSIEPDTNIKPFE